MTATDQVATVTSLPHLTSPQLKPLHFYHIPKNCGTSIEQCGLAQGLLWGSKDVEITHQDYDCKGHSDHRPLAFLLDREHYRHLIEDYDWFAVVRDPYERAISTFYCDSLNGAPDKNVSVAEFNEFIRQEVGKRRVTDHWAPQVYFIYHIDEPEPNYFILGQPIIKHILRYENIEAEFQALMELYQLPVRLDQHLHQGNKKYTVADLEPATIQLINEFYHNDFSRLGYNMITV